MAGEHERGWVKGGGPMAGAAAAAATTTAVERARTQSGPGNPAEKQARMWDVLIYDKETE